MRSIPLAAATAFAATPALADLTAEEVLAEHMNLMGGYGLIDMATTGTTKRADGLTVAGFVGSYEDDKTRIEFLTPGMTLTEHPDGSVHITYPDELAVTINADPSDDVPVSATLTILTTGLTHTVSGSTDDIQHDITFDTLTLGDLELDPLDTVDPYDSEFDIAIAGLVSTIRLAKSAPVRRSVEVQFDGLSMTLSMLTPTDIDLNTPGTTYDTTGIGETDATIALSDVQTRFGYVGHDLPHHSMNSVIGKVVWSQNSTLPGDEGAIDISVNGSGLALSYDVEMQFETIGDNLLQALLDGQRISGAFNFANLAYDFGVATPQGTIVTASTSEASENRFSFSENGLTLFSETGRQVVDMGGPDLGLPINALGYSVDHTMVDLVMPVTPSDARQPFRFRMALDGVATDDGIWDLFDPTGRLPRDPASLILDLEGTTVVAEDIFTDDPEVPFRQTMAKLNEFNFSIAGAEVTGNGSATDTSTDDTPSGVGELDMTLTGVNSLIDTLVDMGLLPNEQAMGARMGLSLIARPDGDDRLVSRIEINEDGQIFANGQRLK